ncbi:MAG TPA: hypothetical protein VMV22_15045, partial [Acidimicrobiales bacterium]|nr:hypothetical protein [Acidimicrobiales bacterium]
MALTDVRVLDALRFNQLVGPYDRFGWNHPGPALFYLLSAVARVLGSGGRADFVGAALINGLSALGVVWVVRRRAGAWPALWAASCMGLLEIVLSTPWNPDVGASVASPWDPYVVIFPLVLFGTLAAVGATGSWPSI